MGIRVLLPDVNRSEVLSRAEVLPEDETPVDDHPGSAKSPHPPRRRAIRVGFMQIKRLNRKTTEAILEERDRGGPFRSLQDLLGRVPIPEGDGTLLIKAGALDSLEPKMSRSQIMWIFPSPTCEATLRSFSNEAPRAISLPFTARSIPCPP